MVEKEEGSRIPKEWKGIYQGNGVFYYEASGKEVPKRILKKRGLIK
ncbi:MAG: hypothetical protein QW478_08910 [Candidatus Micrarchaeaceae archaeon]